MSFAATRVGLRRVRRVLPRQAASDEASSSLQSFTWSTSRRASASYPSRPASPVTIPERRVVPRRVWGSPVRRPVKRYITKVTANTIALQTRSVYITKLHDLEVLGATELEVSPS
ncbi:hypothetical protein O3P69_013221 [Scylla paramamosain]|uniref:Uncharacterized protein n=1 Tax=Scylla paramamosain TaxID=85552 RepID=A0AAW0U2D5_SCYPA